MKEFVLGLDIGITSVGWGIVHKETGDIVDAGVRLFQEASSKGNEDRRNFRSGRRLKRRRAFRTNCSNRSDCQYPLRRRRKSRRSIFGGIEGGSGSDCKRSRLSIE